MGPPGNQIPQTLFFIRVVWAGMWGGDEGRNPIGDFRSCRVLCFLFVIIRSSCFVYVGGKKIEIYSLQKEKSFCYVSQMEKKKRVLAQTSI